MVGVTHVTLPQIIGSMRARVRELSDLGVTCVTSAARGICLNGSQHAQLHRLRVRCGAIPLERQSISRAIRHMVHNATGLGQYDPEFLQHRLHNSVPSR